MRYKYQFCSLLIALIALISYRPACAMEEETPIGDSLAFFPDIVIVGQVVKIEPFSITIENTRYPTTLTPLRLKGLLTRLSDAKDDADIAFYRAIRTVSISPNGHMQMTFYADNLTHLFHDDLNTYQQFLPIFYLFKSNLKELQEESKDLVEKFSKLPMDAFLTIPFIKKLLSNAWFAAIFRIHPETKKLVYLHSRIYESYEELEEDEYARENQIRDIVERGLTTTVRVAIVRGNESQWAKEDVHQKYKRGGKEGSIPGGQTKEGKKK